jgi:hypothetical protein
MSMASAVIDNLLASTLLASDVRRKKSAPGFAGSDQLSAVFITD